MIDELARARGRRTLEEAEAEIRAAYESIQRARARSWLHRLAIDALILGGRGLLWLERVRGRRPWS